MGTASWSNSVTNTLAVSMKAGVNFLGAGVEVETGITIQGQTSRSLSNAMSSSWSTSTQSKYTLPFQADGFLWQWQIRTELRNRQVTQSNGREFAVTIGPWEPQRCLPGYKTDGLKHQDCLPPACELFG